MARNHTYRCTTCYINDTDPFECSFTRVHIREAASQEAALTAEIRQAVGRIEGGMGEDGFRVGVVTATEEE